MIEESIIEQPIKRPRGRPRKEKPADPVVKRPRGRPKKLALVNTILLILAFILKISVLQAIDIQDNFLFCDKNDKTMVDIGNSCKLSKTIGDMTIQGASSGIENTFYVYDHAKYLISTPAYECSMKKSIVQTYKNFIMQNSIENIEEYDLIVTADMCNSMVRSRTCDNSPMTCDNGVCKSHNKLLKEFLWLVNCMIIERAITAESLDENLFGTPNCKPSNGGCALETSYILWDKENLVRCPLYYVTSTNVTKEGNFLVSAKDNLVFNIVKRVRVNHCENTEFYLSNQGLYLSSEKSSTLLPLVKNEFTDLNKIKLAESDLFSFRHREVQKHLAFEVCLSLENILKVAALSSEKFIKITDANEKELVLYSNQGNIFIVKCQNLTNTKIEFINEKENELCEENVKVKFIFDNKVFYGLLDFNNIIRPFEKSV